MMFAKSVRPSELGGTDILGIFDSIDMVSFPNREQFWLVARMHPEPSDVERDSLLVQVFDSQDRCVHEHLIPNSSPTYEEWLEGRPMELWLDYDLTFNWADRYNFQLGTTTQVLVAESLLVSQKEG
ncbi:MAG: hypothetical protein HY672_00500 [Chloroflexi bacterium]|nr:hypothetical protein [Chloroflexota bacterium]